jgi:hypothetical protein
MVVLQGYLSEPQRRALFRSAHAVLANSGREPFGLVGLETMAVGGIAMVGSTGEDYVTPGHDAISLQTNDPLEIVSHVGHLVSSPETEAALRVEAKRSAARYSWPVVIRRVLLPFLARLGVPASPSEPGAWEATTGYPTQIRPLGPAQALPQERAASEPARLHVPREPLKGLPASVA